MKKQLVIGEDKFDRLYIDDEELQDKFDYFICTMKLMGYTSKTNKTTTLMKEQISVRFEKLGDSSIFADSLVVEVTSCGVKLDAVSFNTYKSRKTGNWYYVYEDGLETLYGFFDKMLLKY